jgi:hypothetical protein
VKSLACSLTLAFLALSPLNAAVLWRDPGPIESLDLAGGPGGLAKAPKGPYTFVGEDKGGTAPKITVKDANGVAWLVKFGEEVKAENFASRIAWAAGYFAAPTYYVAEGKIDGVTSLGRAADFVKNGMFRDARFQLKDDKLYEGAKGWNLDDSKLKGSRELAGYKVLMMLLSNWDVKPQNLSILNVNGEQIYAVTDWGATMGRPAELSGRSKWDCTRYSTDSQHLIDGVDNGFVVFNYQGKQGHEILRNIRVDDVAWLMGRLGKLTDAQIEAALKASGATPEELSCFAPAFRTRLTQLAAVADSKPSSEGGTVRTTIRKETTVIRK